MLQSITNGFSWFSNQRDEKAELKHLIDSDLTSDAISWIDSHPHLTHEPIAYYRSALELALSQKNFALAQHLMASEAPINQSSPNHPSVLDQLIIKDDSSLNKPFLGEILATLFSKCLHTFKAMNADSLLQAKSLAYDQLTELNLEIAQFNQNIDSQATSNRLIKNCNSKPLNVLKDYIELEKETFSPKEIFEAMSWAVFHHENDFFIMMHSVFGPSILSYQSTDLKNLYHIAAIADNPFMILTLSKLGLRVQPSKLPNDLKLFSPFHYALMHPTLTSFLALSHARVPYPQALSLNNSAGHLLESELSPKILNPTQLLVLKAMLNDPYAPFDFSTQAYLILEGLFWGVELLGYSEASQTVGIMRSVLRTSLLCSFLVRQLASMNSKNLFSLLSSMVFYGSLISHLNLNLSSLLTPLFKTYKLATYYLLFKKAAGDAHRYAHSSLLRPIDAIKGAARDLFIDSLLFRNIAQDVSEYISKAEKPKTYTIDITSYFKSWSEHSKCDLQPLEGFNSKNLTAIAPQLSQVSETRINCALRQITRSTQAHPFSQQPKLQLIHKLIGPKGFINEAFQKKFYRELTRLIHPDKCLKHFSEAFCSKSADRFSLISDWYN